ncbi:hypothetical protein FRX31_013136 [Thalictrum thalictroides]|uniref:Transmembrane protein n=1 Tax=Thalictrum thalictroides TaxID=46969 RepID=A0A7J6WK49_THATH|nr:hypothetical protein FRX31_013136 [Thalictrum thalictroides]
MHRSGSTSRASDEFFINLSPASKGSPGVKVAGIDNLAAYNPLPETSKKETTQFKSPGENSIHIIPLVLILCVITLWVFSHPVVDLISNNNTDDLSAIKVENVHTHHRYIGNQTDFPLTVKPKDLDQHKAVTEGETEKDFD